MSLASATVFECSCSVRGGSAALTKLGSRLILCSELGVTLVLSHVLVRECGEHYLTPRASQQLLSTMESMERIIDGKQNIMVSNIKVDSRKGNFRVEISAVKRCVDR